jgi:2,5-dioxopentanoate dehydrogenase
LIELHWFEYRTGNVHAMALTFNSVDPRTGEPGPSYEEASPEDVRAAVEAAAAVHRSGALRDRARRAALLRGAAARLRAAGDEIVGVCEAETGLPELPRLRSELERTCGQLEAFADIVDHGDDAEAIIDHPDPSARPIPKPDVRRMRFPIGPVAVFGASNFPLAFSTAGGDTASALAAGCPVVVKGHPSHPGTGELVARELHAAVADAGLPAGTFANLTAAGVEVGEALVDAPEIAAVGFTG